MKKITASAVLSFLFVSLFAQVEGSREMAVDGKAALRINQFENPLLATPVKNQQKTGTCWAFSTTSLLESQAMRNKNVFDLSEMYVVRNIYIEKAKNYVLRQGKAQFGEGALGHDVIRAVSKYGAMPENIYTGLTPGSREYDHSAMVGDLKRYLDTVLAKIPVSNDWLAGYERILDKTMGTAPRSFVYKGKNYDPVSFGKDVLNFNAGDYVNITSFLHHPFYQPFILEVPDNFSNGAYYNLPLNEMLDVIKNALSNGYTVMWDGDVSNSGFMPSAGYAVYRPKKLLKDPGNEILTNEPAWSDTSRQRMFEQLVTQDDHLMHIVSMEKNDGKTFFKIKNSWGEQGPFKGFIKATEGYLAINTVSIVVPRSALPKSILQKLKLMAN